MKYIPLANLKNTTGIVAFCKDAKEIVVVNRNGLPKLALMSREVYENGLGRLTDRVLLNVHRDMELVAEPVLRNGVDEIYVMDYEAYRMRKEYFLKML